MKNRSGTIDFWDVSRDYVYHYLPNIRRASPNTTNAYRDGVNLFIDYLEGKKGYVRKSLTFDDFTRENLKDFLDWLLNVQKYAAKTCNLRLTAIHSLLEYASNENDQVIPIYLKSLTVKGTKEETHSIEYFEKSQMQAILAAPVIKQKSERRNQVILILMYDTAARVQEVLDLTLGSLHLDSKVPFITIFGKGSKCRNVPLMSKTVAHLKHYLKGFHNSSTNEDPVFYATTHGIRHKLSDDSLQKMIKKYCRQCAANGVEMPIKPHCHMIRKTRAMDLYQNGVPLTHIQQLLGHENISTTSGFYAFATLDTLAKFMNRNTEPASEKKWNDKHVLEQIYRL
jgi:site-specific recombinase XerD